MKATTREEEQGATEVARVAVSEEEDAEEGGVADVDDTDEVVEREPGGEEMAERRQRVKLIPTLFQKQWTTLL